MSKDINCIILNPNTDKTYYATCDVLNRITSDRTFCGILVRSGYVVRLRICGMVRCPVRDVTIEKGCYVGAKNTGYIWSGKTMERMRK